MFKLLQTEGNEANQNLRGFFQQLQSAETSYKIAAGVGLLSLLILTGSLFMTLNNSHEPKSPLQNSSLQRSYEAKIAVNLHEAENFERQRADAVSAYETVLGKSPINRRARMGLADSQIALKNEKQLALAKQAIKENKHETAVRYLSTIKGDNPSSREAKALLAHVHKSAAERYLKNADTHCRKKSWLSCQKAAIRVLNHESSSAMGRKLVDLAEAELKKADILYVPAVLSLP